MTENPHNLRPRHNKRRPSDDFQTPENTKCPLCDKKVKNTEDGLYVRQTAKHGITATAWA